MQTELDSLNLENVKYTIMRNKKESKKEKQNSILSHFSSSKNK